jgi:hypothetical protein
MTISTDSDQPNDIELYQRAQRSVINLKGQPHYRYCLLGYCAIGRSGRDALRALRSRLQDVGLWTGAGS